MVPSKEGNQKVLHFREGFPFFPVFGMEGQALGVFAVEVSHIDFGGLVSEYYKCKKYGFG
jgi:hypothetical protein